MDHPDSDRLLTRELETTLTDLRAKNKKLEDEKKAAEGSRAWGWAVAVALIFLFLFVMCGGDGRHHYH
jgi:hypothetical protein